MPELPEVESTVRFLSSKVRGETIRQVTVNWARTVHTPDLVQFKETITNAKIVAVVRRGKFVHFKLTTIARAERSLLTHLRMSGSFDVVSSATPRSKHDHLVLTISKAREIRFHDPRKFGRVYLVDDCEKVTGKLGPEPFDPQLSSGAFYELLQSRRGKIKPALLDQTLIAGLGNIYVDECLWRARIHPARSADSVSRVKAIILLEQIRAVLTEAIESNGTDFGDGVVHAGMFVPAVYGRAGQPCARCQARIRKITLGQRGTHYCGSCQRA